MRHPQRSIQQLRGGLLAVALMSAMLALTGVSAASGPHWSIVKSPPAGSESILNGVVMTKRHGWAVGDQTTKNGLQTTLIERYDAARGTWRVVTSPTPPKGGTLQAVAGGDSNAWTVGTTESGGAQHGLALRWNGSSWKILHLPPVQGGQLSAVTVRSATDAWAVGARIASSWTVPWTVHWNGRTWSTVPTPNPGRPPYKGGPRTASLAAVHVVPGSSAVIAVGTANGVGRGSGNAYAQRWNGKHWSLMSLPRVPGGVDSLSAITALSPSSAWAVGSVYTGSPHTLVMKWNGAHWTRVAAPDPGNGDFSGIAASGPGSAWAIGTKQATNAAWTTPFSEHWDGKHWSVVKVPAAPIGSTGSCGGLTDGYQGLSSVAVTPGSSRVWAVGYHDRLCPSIRRGLIERFA